MFFSCSILFQSAKKHSESRPHFNYEIQSIIAFGYLKTHFADVVSVQQLA